MIYSYKRKKQLEELYENNPNELYKIFIENDLKESDIKTLFEGPKDYVIDEVLRIMIFANSTKPVTEFYTIPKKYKKAEYKSLQDERNKMYNNLNKSIDKKIGETLEALYNYQEDEYITGIHITGNLVYFDGFEKGIPTRERPDRFVDHIMVTKSFPYMLHYIKYCNQYKFSSGAFIIKIPRKSLEKDGYISSALLYYKDEAGRIYIRPEYIVAYVPVLNEKMCDVYINDYPHNKLYNEETEFYCDGILENRKYYGFINILLLSVIAILITFIVFLILK